MRTVTLFLVALFYLSSAAAQQPAQPAAPVAPVQPSVPPAEAPRANPASSSSNKKPLPGFLILGTVFNEKALAFPGVQVRVRRKEEKKFRWETYTNSRGEFAVRVPEGPEYEVFVHVKHFKDESRSVKANSGGVQDRLSIRLEPATKDKEKTGAKS